MQRPEWREYLRPPRIPAMDEIAVMPQADVDALDAHIREVEAHNLDALRHNRLVVWPAWEDYAEAMGVPARTRWGWHTQRFLKMAQLPIPPRVRDVLHTIWGGRVGVFTVRGVVYRWGRHAFYPPGLCDFAARVAAVQGVIHEAGASLAGEIYA